MRGEDKKREFLKDFPTDKEQRAALSGFDAGVEFAKKWIPAHEEKPDGIYSVLVRNFDKVVRIGYYDAKDDEWETLSGYGNKFIVVSWRQID